MVTGDKGEVNNGMHSGGELFSEELIPKLTVLLVIINRKIYSFTFFQQM